MFVRVCWHASSQLDKQALVHGATQANCLGARTSVELPQGSSHDDLHGGSGSVQPSCSGAGISLEPSQELSGRHSETGLQGFTGMHEETSQGLSGMHSEA